MSKTVRLIVFIAALSAVSIVTNVFSIILVGSYSITFNYTISFIAGIFLGPIGGLSVGIVGDVLGHLISPKGTFNPFIFASSGLIGLIPGLVFKFIKIKSDFVKLLISYFACFVICTAFLNTYGLYLLVHLANPDITHKTFWAYFVGRVPGQSIVVIVNFALTFFVMHVEAIKKFFLFMHTPEPKKDKANEATKEVQNTSE